MSYQVIMTETAKGDLRDIARYILEESGDRETARHFVAALREKCRELRGFPNRGALPKDYLLRNAGYRYLVYRHYLIFYVTDEASRKVLIHAFFHEKMDYFRKLQSLI